MMYSATLEKSNHALLKVYPKIVETDKSWGSVTADAAVGDEVVFPHPQTLVLIFEIVPPRKPEENVHDYVHLMEGT